MNTQHNHSNIDVWESEELERKPWNEKDTEFVFRAGDNWDVVYEGGCERGEWEQESVGYGFVLTGFDGENCILVQWSSGQGNRTVVHVAHTMVDHGFCSRTATCKSEQLVECIANLVNAVFFNR